MAMEVDYLSSSLKKEEEEEEEEGGSRLVGRLVG
jgi:hypothetical protein